MLPILINGNFLCRNLTGIERFAWEVCGRLDSLLTPADDIAVLIPKNARRLPQYANIRRIPSESSIRSFPFWDLRAFARTVKKRGACALNFSNTAPIGNACGVAFLHDIYARDCPEDFTSFRDRLVRRYSTFNYANIARHAKKIITVSQFGKSQIQKAYRVPNERIAVIGNGWEHIAAIEPDETVFNRFPALQKKQFYFSLGSISRRKNLVWILRYAAAHPAEHFAISGTALSGLLPRELEALKTLPNVILLGYQSDRAVKALMLHCKAFVFPSYYEGFGIPPLEALAVGAPIIIARAASLPEIYADAAHYLDPADSSVSLPDLLASPVAPPDAVLAAYTYDAAAEKLLAILRSL